MANTLTNILPKILARGLMTLRERAVMPRLVNFDFSREAAERGDTIDVPIPSDVTVIDVAPSNTPPAGADTNLSKVQISLNFWRQNDPFFLTDKEMVEVDRNEHFLPMQVAEAVRALANDVNLKIFESFRNTTTGVFSFTGTAGTTPFASAVTDATNARKLLNKERAPLDDRRGVVDFDAEANMLALAQFSDADKVGMNEVKIKGEIGEKYGMQWVADDQVITHTAGTIDSGSGARLPLVNGTFAIGIDEIDLDETSLTGTIVNGDIISFAGHVQTYVVVDNSSSPEFAGAPLGTYTASGNAITKLKIFPALRVALANNEVSTVEDTHVVNLAFHRDAFAYATRPLIANTLDMALGSKIMSMTDPQTGVVLRLEVSRQHKRVAWEFDILFGTRLVRPGLATRIAG